jgi:NAD(P)H-hydrate epimerase
LSSSVLPTLSSQQVRELDQLAAEQFGVPLDWLMEAAGWRAAYLCDFPTAVVCGTGNNGGDGLAAARHLHRWGRLVSISCVDPTKFRGEAAAELDALRRAGVEVSTELRLDGAQMVLDAIFGTGLNRPPQGTFAEWIEAINSSELTVVSVDVPSGLDGDSGLAYAPCVRAATTVTFTLPKPGLLRLDGPKVAGDVWVADIGIPFEALRAIGVTPPRSLFELSEIVQLGRN